MTETLEQTLVELINKTETAGDWLMDEIPEVIQQLLIWKGASSFLLWVTGVALIVASVKLFKRGLKECEQGGYLYKHDAAPAMIFIILPATVGIIMFFDCTTWLQIMLAPKIYLLEYAAQLMK